VRVRSLPLLSGGGALGALLCSLVEELFQVCLQHFRMRAPLARWRRQVDRPRSPTPAVDGGRPLGHPLRRGRHGRGPRHRRGGLGDGSARRRPMRRCSTVGEGLGRDARGYRLGAGPCRRGAGLCGKGAGLRRRCGASVGWSAALLRPGTGVRSACVRPPRVEVHRVLRKRMGRSQIRPALRRRTKPRIAWARHNTPAAGSTGFGTGVSRMEARRRSIPVARPSAASWRRH
jgi:hypothetical protein